MSSEPDLIARREAVIAAMKKHIICDATGISPAIASVYLCGFDKAADTILTTLEASDADTVRYKDALEQIATASDDGFNDLALCQWIARTALTASHPKPEPVETQPEASRSPVLEELIETLAHRLYDAARPDCALPYGVAERLAKIALSNTYPLAPASDRAMALEEAARLLEAMAERARVAAIGNGMDPSDATLLDYEFSLAAREVRQLVAPSNP